MLSLAVAMVTSACGGGATSVCDLSGHLPFEGMALTPAQAQTDTISEIAAREREAEYFPGIAIKEAALVVISDPLVPAANGRLTWVLLRNAPISPAHDAQGRPIDTVGNCGITVLDAVSGDLIDRKSVV